jgi:hypothetical protein
VINNFTYFNVTLAIEVRTLNMKMPLKIIEMVDYVDFINKWSTPKNNTDLL